MGNTSHTNIIGLFLIGIIILYGCHLRYLATAHTEVYFPIRADAQDYFHYAKNLREQGVYSRQAAAESGAPPRPDALRSPGFPAFAAIFMRADIGASVQGVLVVQTLLQVACFLLLSITVVKSLGIAWSLPALFLLWSFPHFISINTYYLSESIFTSALALIFFLAWYFSSRSAAHWGLVIACGLLLGLTALIRPVVQYFALFALLLSLLFHRPVATRAFVLFCVAALPVLLWQWRNLQVIGTASDPTLMINALYHGSFPDFMYDNRPESFAFPYRFDPDAEKYHQGLWTTVGLIWEKVLASPLEYLRWYILGKQQFLWQWNIIAGQGDIFIYPIIQSPWLKAPDMIAVRSLHFAAHGFWVGAGLLTALAVLVLSLFQARRPDFIWLAMAVFILYVSLLHILIAPFPRYGIPFKLVLIMLAIYGIKQTFIWLGTSWQRFRK